MDLEFDEGSHDAVLSDEIFSSSEVHQLSALRAAHPSLISMPTLVLAAKEALFKAVFPIMRTEFTFSDVSLIFQARTSAFRAIQFPGCERFDVQGAYEIEARWVVVAAVASHRQAPRAV